MMLSENLLCLLYCARFKPLAAHFYLQPETFDNNKVPVFLVTLITCSAPLGAQCHSLSNLTMSLPTSTNLLLLYHPSLCPSYSSFQINLSFNALFASFLLHKASSINSSVLIYLLSLNFYGYYLLLLNLQFGYMFL